MSCPYDPSFALWIARAVVVLHALMVGVTTAGTVAMFTGRFRRFRRGDFFQWLFLACCAGQLLSLAFTGGCFLSQWERALREIAAPGTAYAGAFLDHYLPFLPGWAVRLLQPLSLGAAAGVLFPGLTEWRRRRARSGDRATLGEEKSSSP